MCASVDEEEEEERECCCMLCACVCGGCVRAREEAWIAILVSIVASIPACHAGDPGSIPGRGASFSLSFLSAPRCCSSLPSLLGVDVATGACLVCCQPLPFGAAWVARFLSSCLLSSLSARGTVSDLASLFFFIYCLAARVRAPRVE